MLKKILLVVLLFLSLGANVISKPSKAARPSGLPNIILIIGDDHGYPYFGFMGADYVYTPNMDLLANEGTLFTQAHVTENHCRPSLQTLVTGLHPVQYRQRALAEMIKGKNKAEYEKLDGQQKKDWQRNFDFHAMKYFQTLPRRLAQKGYVSFQGGKWWEFHYKNGYFTEGMTTGWTKKELESQDWFLKFMGGDGLALARQTMQPVYDFIDRNVNNPFFVWYGPDLPHTPHNAPYRYLKYYQNKNLSESAKQYYAMCTWFDEGVGELMDYIHAKGLAENTLVIYVNDNGWEQPPDAEYTGDTLLKSNGGDKGKLSMYDMSYRTPIIFYWPGKIPSGKIRTDLVSTMDLMPTILDYASLAHSDLPGYSLKPVIEGASTGRRDFLIGKATQFRSRQDMMGKKSLGYYLRNREWHFMWFANEDRMELYNMVKDANNDHNVAAAYPDLIRQFKAEIESWRKRMNDS